MRENPYIGINAHLNSSLQTPGTDDQPALWHSFHNSHIGHITDALNSQLPEHYIAFSEQSLQPRISLDDFGEIEIDRPKPDVTIFQQGTAAPVATAVELAPTWQAAIADVLEPVKQPRAAIIREVEPLGKLGRIVARIELLSPSNKPNNRHYASYQARRYEAIDSGVPLIEIDYLHEWRAVVEKLPVYPTHPNALPYMVIVTDPRPGWVEGKVSVYGFRVGEPIHKFPIPLVGSESLGFDLTPVYQHTFHAGRWGTTLDYSAEPERFATYHPEDQKRILEVMNRLAESR